MDTPAGMEVLIGFVMLIIMVTLTSYCIARMRGLAALPPYHFVTTSSTHQDSVVIATAGVGLDDATLGGFPKLLYSQTKLGGDNFSTAAFCCCCSVCLADYKETDVLRVLPDCGHVFHLQCVDSWLRIHPSCPICRSSPNATANPLYADVALPLPVPVLSSAIV